MKMDTRESGSLQCDLALLPSVWRQPGLYVISIFFLSLLTLLPAVLDGGLPCLIFACRSICWKQRKHKFFCVNVADV